MYAQKYYFLLTLHAMILPRVPPLTDVSTAPKRVPAVVLQFIRLLGIYFYYFRWADTMKSESTDGKLRPFVHPFLQACGMFIGEMSCMIAFFIVRWYNRRKVRSESAWQKNSKLARINLLQARRQAEASRSREEPEESVDRGMTAETPFSPFVFLPPALCDMTATSIQYIGLTLTYASSFQVTSINVDCTEHNFLFLQKCSEEMKKIRFSLK